MPQSAALRVRGADTSSPLPAPRRAEVEQTLDSKLFAEWTGGEGREWVKAALSTMQKMKTCDQGAVVKQWLCVPVPVEQVPDYPRVIFHPQDLGTIEAKLRSGGFASPDDWIAAVRTVFRNVFVYNKPDGGIGSVIIKAADCASGVFEKELLRLRGITVL